MESGVLPLTADMSFNDVTVMTRTPVTFRRKGVQAAVADQLRDAILVMVKGPLPPPKFAAYRRPRLRRAGQETLNFRTACSQVACPWQRGEER